MFDLLFPPSLERITRSFERTRLRLTAFSARQAEKGFALREQANDLQQQATSVIVESERAAKIALRFNDLLN